MSPETGSILPTPDEIAHMLERAETQMELSLKGMWAPGLAKARYADILRYQPGIAPEVCSRLYELSSALVRKAQDNDDTDTAEYFGRMAESWGRVGLLLHTERSRV